jgi:tripartite-type tricarboxylate transporter receptor subunit TctC
MVTALLGSEVDVTLDTLAVSYPQVRSGKFRAIATTSPTRLKIAPDVPTISEAGVPGFDYLGWQGILAPAGTPPAVVARLSSELLKILEMPAVRQKLEELGYEPRSSTPGEFLATIKSDSVRYRKVIADAQIKAE